MCSLEIILDIRLMILKDYQKEKKESKKSILKRLNLSSIHIQERK